MQRESRLCKFCPELILCRYHLHEKHGNSYPARPTFSLVALYHLSATPSSSARAIAAETVSQ